MIIDIIKLKSNIVDKIEIDEILNLSNEQLENTDIIELKDVSIKGFITKNQDLNYNLNVVVDGTMVLPCSISLKPTNYHFNFKIDDNIEEMLEEIGQIAKKDENTIDIFPIIWENILMEIPMHIVNEDIADVKLEGDGWKLVQDEDFVSTNPELEKLKDLL